MNKKAGLIWLFAVLAGACGEGVNEPKPIVPRDSIRNLTAAETQVASASNTFAFELLKQANAAETSKPNLMISPLSASMALGMTMNGASGNTFTAMRSTLSFGTLSQPEVNAAYAGLIRQLYARAGSAVQFSLANSVWYDKDFHVLPTFTDTLKHYFDATVQQLDFGSAASPGVISKWAEDKTNGRIKDLIKSIDPNEVMFLINAVYYKAPWSNPFDANATATKPFRRSDGSQVMAPTMSRRGVYRVAMNSSIMAVELPYADSAYSMVVWTPTQGVSLGSAATSLSEANFKALLNGMVNSDIYLEIPKFHIEYEVTLNDILTAMGMGVAFTDGADFSRIDGVVPSDLYITRVFQKSYIDVDEKGTEAAAATGVGIGVVSMPPMLSFNKPFFYAIRERSSGTILFAGRVGDPTLR